jgi:alanine racemase
VAVSSVEGFARLRAAGRDSVGVHVKYDSGMGRWGMAADDALRIGEDLAGGSGPLRLAGLMSHLASADSDNEFTSRQLDRFRALSDRFPACLRHVANSAAAMWRPDARYDAVRCGVGVYGLHPAGGDPAELGLLPVMRFESYVAQIKLLEPGESAGYGRRFVAEQPTWIGLAPAGYADGVPRLMSGRAEVLVAGRRRLVAATISMDQLIFVVGDRCDVDPGDLVVLLGADGDDAIRAEDWAEWSETINYEIVTDIAPRRGRVEHVVVGP